MTARRRVRLSVLVVALVIASVSGGLGSAQAAPNVTVGGGAGVLIGTGSSAQLCTLNSIGRDRFGGLVGLTAGHCASVGETVRLENAAGSGVIGVVRASTRTAAPSSVSGLDYAVIGFDTGKVRPTAARGRVVIAGIGRDPAIGATACKQGRTTGYSCGPVLRRLSATTIIVATCAQPGDSGGPVVAGDRVVGLLRGSVVYSGVAGSAYPSCSTRADAARTPLAATSMGAILADLDRVGRVGAGYRPV
ncbi:S1 family peptidase [Williamsia maris]|uniref:Trypsin n=1 Tax=Williamsia maris TaxID=72806 RepID=A0ABT1HBH7_9NOCA|nr:S1 family peptidase [Williamsia maris]MCP2175277.1 hypothetical protein [Williamsia maris]